MHNNISTGILKSVKEAISQPIDPWFPEVSELITSAAWSKFSLRGFTPENYGTHRWLKNDPTDHCLCTAELDLDGHQYCRIEYLPENSQAYFEEAGLIFPASFPTKTNVETLRSALSLLTSTQSLYETVTQYLRSLHILEAPGDEYDVSHSNPMVPFSIFISIPPSNQIGWLRITESIIHECMHLQLTLIERILPLIRVPETQIFSPWRQELRPLSGVLHGMYVFTVIYNFFEILESRGSLTFDERRFVNKRRSEIFREVTQVKSIASAKELTYEGKRLACYLNSFLNL